MTMSDLKIGRPRRYDLVPSPTFADPAVGLAATALDELRARVIDQIADLPPAVLTQVHDNLAFSISTLVIHLAWAEMQWVTRITDVSAPEDLRARLDPAGRAVPAGERVILEATAAELIDLCHRVRDDVTIPALTSFQDFDAQLPGVSHPRTPRGVLMHVIWHWTYHSGHIGLLRELAGYGYEWTFASYGETPS